MAGNEWINSYLDAILDTGERFDDHRLSDVGSEKSEKNAFQAAKYFVEEVTGFDDKSLYKTWMKATVTRNGLARSSRLENMCWRIWHIARKKKQVERDESRRVATRNIDRDQSRRDATEDMSEDLSEGERVDASQEGSVRLTRMNSDAQLAFAPPDEHKEKRLYIVLISLHGLVRGENMELGRDSDTGGQVCKHLYLPTPRQAVEPTGEFRVKYVVELARALAIMPEVYRVDLLTRQICSPEVDWSYGEPTEMLTPLPAESDLQAGESSGAYIVRIPCGPRDDYIRKELLWPHIQEFVDGALAHILNMARVLGDQIAGGEFVWPHVIHGHYADAGDSASLLSGALNVPMVLTGHSLGRNKLEQLLKQGRHSHDDINSTYRIMRRIEGEELSLDAAELVITSTKQEIEEQWGLYDGFNVKLERVFRARAKRGLGCHGRYMPRMQVIPPGMDFSNVDVQDTGDFIEGDIDTTIFADSEAVPTTPSSPRREPPIWGEIMRFFKHPHKPMILALARPDPKKNITTLLNAFGECTPLRELANLTLIMGNREDIDMMSGANGIVLTTVLKLIDKHDLYGLVAYPKRHCQNDVPEIYRLAAKTKGVFINPALVEPFGLTLIEAAAHGLPMVATKNGGPVDILRTLNNGLLVDPHDDKSIAEALLKLVSDRTLWTECRRNGLKNIPLYSWPQHCRVYLSKIALCRMRHPEWQNDTKLDADADADSQGDSLRDVRDLRLSVDGDKLPAGSLSNPADLEKALRISGDHLQRSTSKRHARLDPMSEETELGSRGSSAQSTSNVPTRIPIRKKRRLVIVAVDSYDPSTGEPDDGMVTLVQSILKSIRSEGNIRSTGYILSTALSVTETQQLLKRAGISILEFDAIVCSSGSKLYYPSEAGELNPDADYDAHIDYRWGGEGLKKTMARYIAGSDDEVSEKKRVAALAEDEQGCNAHCLAYRVLNSSVVPAVDDFRRVLRKRGLRCHVIYSQAATKLHLLPLLASRSQALRYLFVRWGLDVANMILFVGETGDTDYEEMLSGTHKTLILKDAVQMGSDKLLRAPTSYHKDDVVPAESPNIIFIQNTTEGVLHAVKKLGLQF